MIPIICVDDRLGFLFNNRRLSRDENLYEWLFHYLGKNKLWINEYSAKLFPDNPNTIVSDSYLQDAGEGAYCFVESTDINEQISQAEKIILCKWNRKYPSDVKISAQFLSKWKVETLAEIAGSSHEKITIELYTK